MTLADLPSLSNLDLAAAGTAQGRAWIASLESRVRDLAWRWSLTVTTKRVRHGYDAVIVPVEHDGQPGVLKLVWPAEQAAVEARGLAAWEGRGVVRLLRVEPSHGALLLERLDASRPLSRLPWNEAAPIAGRLIRQLALAHPPTGLPTTQDEAKQIGESLERRQRALSDPIPRYWLRLAAQLARSLSVSPAAALVHTDLHYGNVLASYRSHSPWVAIDPKAHVGDPERSVAEMLWTQANALSDDRAIRSLLGLLIDSGHLSRQRALAWAFLRVIDYWLWGLENGLTEDPANCERIAGALADCGDQPTLSPAATFSRLRVASADALLRIPNSAMS